MGYFPVRYDSSVVNYDRRGFIRLATGLLLLFVVFAAGWALPIYAVNEDSKKTG